MKYVAETKVDRIFPLYEDENYKIFTFYDIADEDFEKWNKMYYDGHNDDYCDMMNTFYCVYDKKKNSEYIISSFYLGETFEHNNDEQKEFLAQMIYLTEYDDLLIPYEE